MGHIYSISYYWSWYRRPTGIQQRPSEYELACVHTTRPIHAHTFYPVSTPPQQAEEKGHEAGIH